jgi:hypothetical protein
MLHSELRDGIFWIHIISFFCPYNFVYLYSPVCFTTCFSHKGPSSGFLHQPHCLFCYSYIGHCLQ